MTAEEASEEISMADFIRQAGVTMTAEQTDSNPAMDDSRNMDHWKVVLRRPATRSVSPSGCRLTITFSKGCGHHGAAPELDEVLDCLAMDAAGVANNATFEEWCGEYGYDTDSRKAERTFKLCRKQADGLRRLLGDEHYQTLLWKVTRL